MASAPTLNAWFWLGAAPPTAVAVPRDPRVDIFRGLSLLIIFVDHVAGNWLSRITPSAMGFSDAAEYFVLLAGYSAAFAYGAVMDRRGLVPGSAQVVARIWKLYSAHLALFVFMAVGVAFMAVKFGNPLYYEHVSILPFFQDPATTILQTAALLFLPNYLDILPLYVVLLAMLPALWVLTRIAPAVALMASAGLYVAAWMLEWTLPNLSTGGSWFFNPFAWQLIFTFGLVSGHATLRGVSLPRHWILAAAAIAVVAYGFASAAPWAIIPGLGNVVLPDDFRLDLDKTNLSLWRLAHALSLAYIVARFVPTDANWMKSLPGRLLEEAGRHSLALFCLGVILSLLGTFVFFEIGRDGLMQIVVNVVGITILLLTAQVLQWYRRVTQKVQPQKNRALDEARPA
jgi:hypothetical protein